MTAYRLTWDMEVLDPGRAATKESAPLLSASEGVQLFEQLVALKDDNAHLQRLVCELLWKNENLRRRIREMTGE